MLRTLQSNSGPRWLAALAFSFSLRAIGAGFQADDHVIKYAARFSAQPFSLFSADAAEMHILRDTGRFAWWASPRLVLAFFRPLSSLSHWIDYQAWPDAAWVMHLENSIVYALLVWAAAHTYRALLPDTGLAALAASMFAIDEAHAPAVGWISSRNTLFAALFAVLALLWHVRGRAEGRRGGRWLSTACVGLALLSGESGVMSLALLSAYALVFESGSWLARLRSVAPQLAVFTLWAIAYWAEGWGIRGTTWYHELGYPGDLLMQGILDVPLWLLSFLGPSVVSFSAALQPSTARLTALCIVTPVLIGFLIGVPRSRDNRFFALALLACAPALFTTIPQERVTTAATFAAFGLIASLLVATKQHSNRALRWYRGATFGVHLGLAPLLFITLNIDAAAPIELGSEALARTLTRPAPKAVVLLNAPAELLTMYASIIATPFPSNDNPQSLHALYAGSSTLIATRVAADTLELRAETGWGALPIERIFCAKRDLPKNHSERTFSAMHVSVLATTPAGLPRLVRFRFPTALESPERRWLIWESKSPVPWQPPALGQRVTIPALSLATAL